MRSADEIFDVWECDLADGKNAEELEQWTRNGSGPSDDDDIRIPSKSI
jgi:hypothetical protein